MALGAEGVQIGTAFLGCEESGSSRLHREALAETRPGQTGLTKGFTGRLARGLRNRLMDELNRPDVEILPYPLQRALVRNLTTSADAARRPDLAQMWAGQSASLSRCTDVAAWLKSLVQDVSEVAGHVAQWNKQGS
jgi:nitronate monooxygenase